ncbi:hypothetical protein SteCoe_37533 [Stentor coeruleus]|uniref:UBC core domain-containing protein n=1 Tax=Stentor coeruleus TaxID=5963 RepID=A0A1R2AMY8_9CILI|nr:hypothetical protein SteCoe_37533 [Stentor coeruleus]
MSRESFIRLNKEYKAIQKEPIPNAIACPDPKNWLRWHYVIYGLDGPFNGGVYYGELRFPYNYPMGPPSIIMHTPNGRFISGQKICTSMSDFHPETWSPIWKVSTILTGLISFMLDKDDSAGCESTTTIQKESLAKKSMDWNNKNLKFNEIFEDYIEILTPVLSQTTPRQTTSIKPIILTSLIVIFLVSLILLFSFLSLKKLS